MIYVSASPFTIKMCYAVAILNSPYSRSNMIDLYERKIEEDKVEDSML